MSARRSVSRVLSRDVLRRAGMAIHLGPPVARRLMRPTRGLGSAPLPLRRSPADGLRPPIWPCSGWSLPVSLRSTACAAGRHRHCGTGPRLTAGGRYPPPCAAELGLSSRIDRVTPSDTRDHPTASLTDRCYTGPDGRPAGPEPISRQDAGLPRPARPARRDRSPRWRAHPRPSSRPAARGRPTSARTRTGSAGRPSRAGSASRP